METEEIYNLTIAPPISSPFAAEWSQDNHISILTERGIHVFELLPTPTSSQPVIKFVRTFVYSPLQTPVEVLATYEESCIWQTKREEFYSLLLQESLTPKVADLAEMMPKIVSAAWSPQNLAHPNKCVLAILTSAGLPMILLKINIDWYPVYDLLHLRNTTKRLELSSESQINVNDRSDFHKIRDHGTALHASAFTWSKYFDGYAYLIVAYCDGDLVAYKIPKIENHSNIPQPQIIAMVNLRHDNEPIKVSSLLWITGENGNRHRVVVGHWDGRISSLEFDEHGRSFKIKDFYHSERDRIPVGSLRILRILKDTDTKILVSKGPFLFLIRITSGGVLKDVRHMQTEGYSISGTCDVGNGLALVTSEDGVIVTLNCKDDKFSVAETKHSFPHTRVRYMGIAHSPSYAILILLTNPNTTYDHLVTKEPGKMYLFSLKDVHCDLWNSLHKNSSERFEGIWDYMEVIRIRASRSPDPRLVLPQVPKELKLESSSLRELRTVMWLSIIQEICESKKPGFGVGNTNIVGGITNCHREMSDVQSHIFLQTACDYLARLMEKPLPLSEEEELSVNSLRMYLEVYLAGEEENESTVGSKIFKRANQVLSETVRLVTKRIEHCNLCGETINDLPWNVNKCTEGHLLPRCAITLLQITTAEYTFCPICGQIFHSCLGKVYDVTRCPFCDVPAIKDTRILDDVVPNVGKSLSRPTSRATTGVNPQLRTGGNPSKNKDESETQGVDCNNE